jgi:phenylalanyl-tRNA synthetase beta chain
MNISYNWLKDLIDIDLSASETAAALTRIGVTVEGVQPHGDDFVLDIDLTSNRPDCLSHLGVARELGVITGKHLTAETQRRGEETAKDVSIDAVPFPSVLAPEVVRVEDADLCHRFTARIVKNVKIGPSPKWLVDRLEAIGERSINNVADITNYVMHEIGQPMHSFDLDKLTDKRIVVRKAKPGETIKTLDEVERKLDETMLAICDAEKPVAVAGIMGGLDSSITDSTTNVLLEVAFFKRESVRATSRKLGLATEASYRFERGVDIENLVRASNRATELIVELAGGEPSEIIDVYPTKFTPNTVESPDISAAVKRLTGLDVETAECLRILSALGIEEPERSEISDLKSQIFTSPSWRHDIAIEEDLVEEIARHAGYENIAEELPPAYGAGEYQGSEHRESRLRLALIDQGFDESLSYSFIDTKHDGVVETVPDFVRLDIDDPLVTLKDSVIEGSVRMRPTLLPGLLDAVRLNFNHQRRDLKLFELGKAFSANLPNELPNERELFAIAVTGGDVVEGRKLNSREVDFYDAKGAVESALEAVGSPQAAFVADEIKHLRRGQSAAVVLDGKKVGSVGRLNEEIAADYKFKQPVYVAEIDIQAVLAATPNPRAYAALPKFPSIVRDVSFAVTRDVSFAMLRDAANDIKPELCREISFVDIYEGKGLDDDKRSLTVRFEYRSDDRTLTESDVEEIHSRLVAAIEQNFSIRQRI